MRKIILPLIFTVFLIPVVILIWSVNIRTESIVELSNGFVFMIQSGGYQQDISVWSEDGENYYVFFPSYVGLSDASIQLNTSMEIFLDGQLLTEDYDLSVLDIETPYKLNYFRNGKTKTVQLTFLQSANVATMYIHTESGSMDKIHSDKNYKENAGIILVDTEGNVNYAGNGNDKIKGRGNATWSLNKKPYTLQLHTASTMLGMDAAEKWILLSNSTDVSNIRNKLVYDFAEKTDLYWTPDCEYIDLYLNGEYVGLYLLTEKIEISKTRLDLNEDTYLFAIETRVAENNLGNYFSIEGGSKIEITNPINITDQEIEDFHTYIQLVEKSILSGSSDLFGKIDLDSWVRKYLIEEIFINLDAGLNSQYFYWDERFSSKIFAGPVWDYDYSLGNQSHLTIQNPVCFYASKVQQSPARSTPWYAALCHNEVFYRRLVEIYQDEYLLLLNDLVSHDITVLSDKVEQAAENNNIRWASLFKERRTYREDVQYIQSFLKERIDFLNCAWIDGISYYTIQLYPLDDGFYLFFNVESGKTIDLLPSPDDLGISDSAIWYIDGTNKAFDISEPITGDIFLRAQTASELEAKANQPFSVRILKKIKNNIKIVISFGMLLALMLALLVADWRRNQRKEGRVCEQHDRIKVSL